MSLCIYLDFLYNCRDAVLGGPFRIGWRAPARLRYVAFFFILEAPEDAAETGSLRLCSLSHVQPFARCRDRDSLVLPPGILHCGYIGQGFGFTLCVFVYLSLNLHHLGSVKHFCCHSFAVFVVSVIKSRYLIWPEDTLILICIQRQSNLSSIARININTFLSASVLMFLLFR